MINQDYILLILNCKKYRVKAIAQKNTWLKQIPSYIKYYHVIGDPDMEVPFSFDEKENILYVKTNDDYNSLPHKIISAYDAIERTYNFTYIFKTDDDQQLLNVSFFDIVINTINNTSPRINYGGFVVNVRQPHISAYFKIHPELPKDLYIKAIKYCNGRFYLLSKESVTSIILEKDKISKEYLEDYAIGLYLPDNLKENVLNINTDAYFKDFV